MLINTENMMSITDVNHNFSKAVKAVEKSGELVILKQNKPRYMLLDLERFPQFEMSDDEKVMFVGQRILNKHINAFKELAK